MAESLAPSCPKDAFLLFDIWRERKVDLGFSGGKKQTVFAEFLLHRPLSGQIPRIIICPYGPAHTILYNLACELARAGPEGLT